MDSQKTFSHGTLAIDNAPGGSFPKDRRLEYLAGAAVVYPSKTPGVTNTPIGRMADPANGFILRHDPAKQAPRGGYGSYSFCIPVDGQRPLEHGKNPDMDFLPLSEQPYGVHNLSDNLYVKKAPTAPGFLTRGTGHDVKDLYILNAGGPIVAHHRTPDAPDASIYVHDVDPDGSLSKDFRAGLHGLVYVAEQGTKSCLNMLVGGRQLALNWGLSGGPDKVNGAAYRQDYGLIMLPGKSGARAPIITGGGRSTTQAASSGATITEVTQADVPNILARLQLQGPQAVDTVPRVFGYAANTDAAGPFTAGFPKESNQYHIWKNDKGEIANSLAISTNAVFTDGSQPVMFNGPWHFESKLAPGRADGGHPVECHIQFDLKHKAVGPCGKQTFGRWVVWTTQPSLMIDPGFTPIDPGVPPDGPPPPPPPPPPGNPPPPVIFDPFERDGPSWLVRPRPCINTEKDPVGNPGAQDIVERVFGFGKRDFAKMPYIAHVVGTARLMPTVEGEVGVLGCPPNYARGPEWNGVTEAVWPIYPGLADGVIHIAPANLKEWELKVGQTTNGIGVPSFNIWSGGTRGNSVFGFGVASQDLGEIVAGFRFYMDSSGNLNIEGVDDDGVTDNTRTINFLTPTNIGGGGMTNPMTTIGDMIIGDTGGDPIRLAAGTDGYILTMVSGSPAWAAAPSGTSKWTVDGTTLYPTAGETLKIVNGSATAPSYAFVNSTQMGMYRAGANILGFSTDGVERGRVTADGRWQLGGTATTNDQLFVQNAITSDPAATTAAIRANVTAASIALTGSVNAFVANVNLSGTTGCTQIVSGGSNNITIGSTGTFGAAIENLTLNQTINAASTLNGNLYTINSSHVISNGTRSSTTDIGSDFTVNVSGGSGGRFMFPLRARITGNTGFASTQAAVLGQVSDLSPASSRFIAGVFGYNATAVATAITQQSYGIVCSANGLGFTTAVALTNQCDVRLYRSGTRTLTLQGGTSSTTASLVITGDLTVNGNTVIGDATGDTLTITARVNSDIVPSTNDTRSLGAGSLRFTKLWVKDIGGTGDFTCNTIVGGYFQATEYLRNDGQRLVKFAETSSSTYNVGVADHVVECNTSGGNITVNLPTLSGNLSRVLIIKKIHPSNTVTIDGAGSETIDGDTVQALNDLGCITIMADATEWRILQFYDGVPPS